MNFDFICALNVTACLLEQAKQDLMIRETKGGVDDEKKARVCFDGGDVRGDPAE